MTIGTGGEEKRGAEVDGLREAGCEVGAYVDEVEYLGRGCGGV